MTLCLTNNLPVASARDCSTVARAGLFSNTSCRSSKGSWAAHSAVTSPARRHRQPTARYAAGTLIPVIPTASRHDRSLSIPWSLLLAKELPATGSRGPPTHDTGHRLERAPSSGSLRRRLLPEYGDPCSGSDREGGSGHRAKMYPRRRGSDLRRPSRESDDLIDSVARRLRRTRPHVVHDSTASAPNMLGEDPW